MDLHDSTFVPSVIKDKIYIIANYSSPFYSFNFYIYFYKKTFKKNI